MIAKLNPVIANYDVLFFGKKGFSSFARARKYLFRPKGDKKAPWQVVDVSKLRKKLDKQTVLFRALEESRRELEALDKKKIKAAEKAERERIKKLQSTKAVKTDDEIKFRLVRDRERIVRSKEKKDVRYREYVYELKKLLRFVSGTKSPNSIQIEYFLLAVGEQFKKIFRKHGRTRYYLRITHRYRGLKARVIRGKLRKFDGMSIPRFEAENLDDIDAAIEVLRKEYLPAFQEYLKHANANTIFDFLGFTLEVTLPNLR